MRGYTAAGVPEAVENAGGAVFAVTSEPQTLADEAHESWELPFDVIGDPHHEVSESCRQHGWLELFVNREMGILEESAAWLQHPKGYYQPGVLALSREGRVLYRWRGRPTRRNAGGALARPQPLHVWRRVQAALAEPAASRDAPLDTSPPLDSPRIPWPLFVTLLLANGNFLRPKGYALRRQGPNDVPRRQLRALAKLALALAGAAAAFALLPSAVVLAGLAAWALAITPAIRRLNREFQNLPAGAGRAARLRRRRGAPRRPGRRAGA